MRCARTTAWSARPSTSWSIATAGCCGIRCCRKCPKEGRLAIYRAKFETLARLHAVDYAALGLADFGRPGSYVARQISRWGKQYKASETETIEAMDRLLDWLPAHLPANDETVLVHGDYRLDNMVFHPTEPRVLGVIDWEISTLGDPLAELSYLCMLWRTPKDWGGLQGHDLAALGLPTEQEMVAYYCELSKRAVAGPGALGILHGLQSVSRVLHPPGRLCARRSTARRPTSAPPNSGKLVRPAAELAWQTRRRHGRRRAMSKRKTARRRAAAAVVERDGRPPVEAIRAAAFAQFAERGYPVVTVRDIMKACGLTQGALYNHFKSKDELLHDIIASTQAELERLCQQAVAAAGDDPRAKLAAFVRAYVVRHCRLRVEALVANREISWLDAERVRRHPPQPPRHPRHRGRHPVARASNAACSIRRRSTAGATSRRWPWRCSISAPMSRCGTVPGGAAQRGADGRLYADMALRAVGAKPQ